MKKFSKQELKYSEFQLLVFRLVSCQIEWTVSSSNEKFNVELILPGAFYFMHLQL